MTETLIVVFLLLVSGAIAARLRSGRRSDPGSGNGTSPSAARPSADPPPATGDPPLSGFDKAVNKAGDTLYRWRVLHGASLIAADLAHGPQVHRPFPGAVKAAETVFDPDILAELRAAAAGEDAMWQAFTARFGAPRRPNGPQEHAAADPGLAQSVVRRLRAVDEQLARRYLPPAEKPPDWDTFFAAGQIPIPPPPWPTRIAGPVRGSKTIAPTQKATAEATAEFEARAHRWLAEAKTRADTPSEKRLLDALVARSADRQDLLGLKVLVVPPLAGSHRQYHIDPWGRFYLHLFVREPVDEERVDIVFAYGLKGQVYRFGAVIIDTAPAGRRWTRGASASGRTDRLRRKGYEVVFLTASDIKADPRDAADRILDRVAALLL